MYHGEVTGQVIRVFREEHNSKVKSSFKDGGKYERIRIVLRHAGIYDTAGLYTYFQNRFNQIPAVVENDEIEIKFIIEAREYKEKWYLNAMIKELTIIKSVDVNEIKERGDEIREDKIENETLPF